MVNRARTITTSFKLTNSNRWVGVGEAAGIGYRLPRLSRSRSVSQENRVHGTRVDCEQTMHFSLSDGTR